MKRIFLSVPHMGGREQVYLREAFSTNWLSTVGPHIQAFERQFREWLGVEAVALSSGTAAIHLGLRALGVRPGDTVFCSDFTFVASVNPVRYLGARPVFIDSEPGTWNMDPALLARALREAADRHQLPKAVVVVHLFGQCADMDPILEICRSYGVAVFEDAAEALGALYKGRPAGTLGDVGIFSFNGNKIITTTGGGMLVSRDAARIAKIRYWATQARNPGGAYDHTEIGHNYALSNVLAAIGRGQFEVLPLRIAQRRAVEKVYREAFSEIPGITPMPEAESGLHTHWLSCFLLDEARLGWSRDELMARLDAADIESRPLWKPMHRQPLYASEQCYGGAVAEGLFRQGICLPSSSSLTPAEQARVIDVVCGSSALTRLKEHLGTTSDLEPELATVKGSQ